MAELINSGPIHFVSAAIKQFDVKIFKSKVVSLSLSERGARDEKSSEGTCVPSESIPKIHTKTAKKVNVKAPVMAHKAVRRFKPGLESGQLIKIKVDAILLVKYTNTKKSVRKPVQPRGLDVEDPQVSII